MDVLAQARAAVEAGADPADVLTILATTNNPAADKFGTENIVKGDWVPAGAEFDGGEENMDWYQTAQALLALLQQPQGGAGAPPAAPPAPGVEGGGGQPSGPPPAFAGLGQGPNFENPEGQGLWVDTVTGGGASPEEEDPWYKGLLGSLMSDGKGGNVAGQSGYQVAKAPALAQVAQQQRRPRERMKFNIPPALRSLMGG